jgi:hypothetical protein
MPLAPNGIRTLDRPARGIVAIPTELPRLIEKSVTFNKSINNTIAIAIIIIITTTATIK